MILTGNEDLRVVKTIEAIKRSFSELICEKPYGRITVKELCERAQINKKTFYNYYETMDALVAEMQDEMSAGYLKRIAGLELPKDLSEVNRIFFEYSIEQGAAYERITLDTSWEKVRNQMIQTVNDYSWQKSVSYQRLSSFEKTLLLSFIRGTTLAAYRKWVEDGKQMPIDEVLTILNRLQLGGVQGFFPKV